LCINQKALHDARESNDVVLCQEILQKAFRTDVRPIVNEMRRLGGGAIDPIMTYRKLQVRQQLVQKRGSTSRASGL
ncbi:MAG: sugar isomerase, partial [Saprospiraceae bacterium]|nr:sugar isomerase [Saprospiraceae bacterium]